jgi:hypothetical protein
MPRHFSNYYAFPFILLLSWPLIAFLVKKKLDVSFSVSWKKLLLSVILITGSSVMLFPNNNGNHDNSPWRNFYFDKYKTIFQVEKFVKSYNIHKKEFGNILVDESMAAFLTKKMKIEEYGYLNNYSLELQKKADTVIFYMSDTPLNRVAIKKMNDIILENKLVNICHIKDTNIVVATKNRNVLQNICK